MKISQEEKEIEVANCIETSEQEISNNRLWHSRYGHLGEQNLSKLANNEMVSGLGYKKKVKDKMDFCEPCAEGKQQHTKFPKDGSIRAKNVLDLVHTDVCGKMDQPSLGKKEYLISFIDDKSRYLWTYPIRRKSDAYDTFLEWKVKVEKSSERKLKEL